MKVLILGSSGLLGCTLTRFLISHGYTVKTHARSNEAQYQADLSVPERAKELLRNIQPEIIVNLIGLTDVDLCEAQLNQAYLVNVRTVENVSGWIRQDAPTCHLIHISTDQVYDGIGSNAEQEVKLTNCYAFSKYAGELAAAHVPSTVLRTNFFGRSHCSKRESLTDWIFRSLSGGKSIQVFNDVLFSPLSMVGLSKMIELSIQRKPVGLFNLGSNKGMSKADFAFAFANELNLPTHTMARTTTDQVTFLKTYRPKDMRMNCARFEYALDVTLPDLEYEIIRAAKEYSEIT